MKRAAWACAAFALLAAGPSPAQPKLDFPVKNVIFDVGGVLVSLNEARFQQRMAAIVGPLDGVEMCALMEKFDTGALNEAQFLSGVRRIAGPRARGLSDARIIDAWDSEIGDADCRTLEMIRGLRAKGLKTYVLSTTNPLHVKAIEKGFRGCFPGERGDALRFLFDKRYYTSDLGLLKPDPAIYRKVLADGGMNARETLFLDDSPANVIGAQQAGLFALFVPTIGTGPRFRTWLPALVSTGANRDGR